MSPGVAPQGGKYEDDSDTNMMVCVGGGGGGARKIGKLARRTKVRWLEIFVFGVFNYDVSYQPKISQARSIARDKTKEVSISQTINSDCDVSLSTDRTLKVLLARRQLILAAT